MYDIVIYIGRFSPVHKAHLRVIEEALKQGTTVLMLIGSSDRPRTIKNPWTYEERVSIIQGAITDKFGADVGGRVCHSPLKDYPYSDTLWALGVQSQVEKIKAAYAEINYPHDKIAIIGCSKDQSSYYLKMFPQWDLIEVPVMESGLSATQLRTAFFEGDEGSRVELRAAVMPSTLAYLDRFTRRAEYEELKGEFEFENKHKTMWANAPYPPTFNTVDSIVVCNNHVLLVKRRFAPGRGLWALPGGYINQKEFLFDACIRELREETRLRVAPAILKGSLKAEKTFDHPERSLRGRIITQAFFFQLDLDELPPVRGDDDAERAQWIPLAQVRRMSEVMFEDHFDIVNYFVNLAE